MSNGHVQTSNYAKMLFSVAKEEGKLSQVLYDLKEIAKIKSQEIRKLLLIPIISRKEKIKLISELEKLEMILSIFIKMSMM